MVDFQSSKVLSALQPPLSPDTVYYVRVGEGFDQYVTDENGIAFKQNGASSVLNIHDKIDDSVGLSYFYFGWQDIGGQSLFQRQDRVSSQSLSFRGVTSDFLADWDNRFNLGYA